MSDQYTPPPDPKVGDPMSGGDRAIFAVQGVMGHAFSFIASAVTGGVVGHLTGHAGHHVSNKMLKAAIEGKHNSYTTGVIDPRP